MDTASASVPRIDDLIPPPDPRSVLRVGAAGFGLTAAAALVGIATAAGWGDTPAVWDGVPASHDAIPWPLHTLRLLLCGVGALLAGAAISMRPSLWKAWLLAAGTGLLAAVIALPDHWDSARLLARVLTGLAAAGTVLAYVTPLVRYSLVSLAVLFHFGGILTATTWPEPAPWVTQQMAGRVYLPYLSFAYMRNAYHFYSPEPGPASQLFVLVKYDEVDPATGKAKAEWLVLPRRHEHMKDPLGLTYYRRLSITEAVAGTVSDLFTATSFEKLDARERRARRALRVAGNDAIPLAPPEIEPQHMQYRIPRPDITRYLLPSYAEHIAVEHEATRRTKVASIKLYRAEHRIIPAYDFVQGKDPFDPVGYRVYYLGEYAPDGTLVNPQDEMLYWLVPVVSRPGGPSPMDPEQRHFDEYLSRHAGYDFDWRRMRP
ncbi:MAG TPA: hypothetical protein VM533_07115 [Fimbriiglobus sp.]|jgi:hypothetical protein|nr:hypothetical protein [Fimbriiglobus sp.]